MPAQSVAYHPLQIRDTRPREVRRVVVDRPAVRSSGIRRGRTTEGILADLFDRPDSLIQTALSRHRRKWLAKEEDRGRIAATEGRTIDEIKNVSKRFEVGYYAVRGIDDANKELDELTAHARKHAEDPDYDFAAVRDRALQEYFDREEYQNAPITYKAALTDRIRQRIGPLSTRALLSKKEAEQEKGLELLLSTSALRLRREAGSRTEIHALFQDVHKDFIALGGDEREYNRWRTQEIIGLATARNDASLLTVADIPDPDGVPLSAHTVYGKHFQAAKVQFREKMTQRKALGKFQKARALFDLRRIQNDGRLTPDVLDDYLEAGIISPARWASKQQELINEKKQAVVIAENARQAWSSGAPELPAEEQAAAFEYLIVSVPEEQRARATGQWAALNGALPRKKKYAMEQSLHTQSRKLFEKAYDDFNVLRESAPAVAADLKPSAGDRALLFGNLLDANGGDRDAAWELLRNSESNIAEAKATLRKDPYIRRLLREELKDVLGDGEDISPSWQLQQRGEEHAAAFLATGAYSPEYAVEMAADRIARQSHVEDGIRVPNADVLPHWTDTEIREEALKTTFREHLGALNLDEDPDEYAIIPDRDGSRRIGHVVSKETGVVLDTLDMQKFLRPAVKTVSQRRRRQLDAQLAAAADRAERSRLFREREQKMAEDPVHGRFHKRLQGL